MKNSRLIRWVSGLVSTSGLIAIFLFQKYNVAALAGLQDPYSVFAVNRSIRFLLNDLFAMGIIYALFANRRYVWFAFVVQLGGMILFLLPYLCLKYYLPHYNGPLINFLHRLILNPVLLLLLIPAFYYQKRQDPDA